MARGGRMKHHHLRRCDVVILLRHPLGDLHSNEDDCGKDKREREREKEREKERADRQRRDRALEPCR